MLSPAWPGLAWPGRRLAPGRAAARRASIRPGTRHRAAPVPRISENTEHDVSAASCSSSSVSIRWTCTRTSSPEPCSITPPGSCVSFVVRSRLPAAMTPGLAGARGRIAACPAPEGARRINARIDPASGSRPAFCPGMAARVRAPHPANASHQSGATTKLAEEPSARPGVDSTGRRGRVGAAGFRRS
jgi:hypothetical protein